MNKEEPQFHVESSSEGATISFRVSIPADEWNLIMQEKEKKRASRAIMMENLIVWTILAVILATAAVLMYLSFSGTPAFRHPS